MLSVEFIARTTPKIQKSPTAILDRPVYLNSSCCLAWSKWSAKTWKQISLTTLLGHRESCSLGLSTIPLCWLIQIGGLELHRCNELTNLDHTDSTYPCILCRVCTQPQSHMLKISTHYIEQPKLWPGQHITKISDFASSYFVVTAAVNYPAARQFLRSKRAER